MTHTPLTKAEREELPARIEAAITTVCSGMAAMRIPANPRDVDLVLADCARALADLDRAEAERDALRKIAVDCCNATDGMCTMGVSIEFLSHVPKEVALLKANRNMIAAQRDRAEAERDDIREEARNLRDVLRRNNYAPCDTAACNCNGWHERSTGSGFYARFREIEEAVGDHNGKTLLKAVQEIVAQRDRAESELDAERKMRGEAEAAAKRAEAERDALKAKLAAAESAHSELFLSGQVAELRGKLAALVEAVSSAETILGNMAKETGRVFGRWEINHEPLRNDAQRMLPSFRAAIAAARGGAQ